MSVNTDTTVSTTETDTTVSTVENPTYHRFNICGYCGEFAKDHPYVTDCPWESNCYRDKFLVGSTDQRWDNLDLNELTGEVYGDFQDTDQYGFPIVEHGHVGDLTSDVEDTSYRASLDEPVDEEFSSSRSTDRWNVAYDSAADQRAVDAYRDKFPTEQTVTLDQYRKGVRPNANTTDVQRNVFHEGKSGFLTIQAYDEHVTELFQNKCLNVYTDKEGRLRVGSIALITVHNRGPVLEHEAYGYSVDARCVNERANCHAVMNSGVNPSRKEMEEFVVAVIRHGNNHAGKWFKERINKSSSRLNMGSIGYSKWTTPLVQPTYYKVHAENCDLSCDPNAATCAYSSTATSVVNSLPTSLVQQRLMIELIATANDNYLAMVTKIRRQDEQRSEVDRKFLASH